MRLVPIVLTIISLNAFALERDLVVGSETPRPWAELERREGTTTETGWHGLPDLVLEDWSYAPDPETELLLHFDSAPPSDAAGRYTVTRPGALRLSTAVTAYGTGSAAFDGGAPVVLEPARSGRSQGFLGVGDFSIEMWFRPLHLGEGETVLAWSSQRARDGTIRTQAVSARVRGRTLEWTFAGVFSAEKTVSFKGLTPLIPGQWANHLLRYDASTGLIEYLVGGLPEAVSYVTSTGRDGGSLIPLMGDSGGRLMLGEGFTGFVDELRVTHRFVERPRLARYSTRAATTMTRPLDLGNAGSRLLRIEVVSATPGSTALEMAYRLSEDPFFDGDVGWKPLKPGTDIAGAARGRFVQVRADLMSDGTASPRLSRMRIVYEPNFPPPPPARVVALAGDGSIQLSWQRVYDDDVAGYLVYYGTEPGMYTARDGAAGPSPVDAGNATTCTLTGLTNGRLYYAAIVSYDQAFPRQQSRFSAEVSARPSPLAPGFGPAPAAAPRAPAAAPAAPPAPAPAAPPAPAPGSAPAPAPAAPVPGTILTPTPSPSAAPTGRGASAPPAGVSAARPAGGTR